MDSSPRMLCSLVGKRDLQRAWDPVVSTEHLSRKWRRLSEAGLLGVVGKGPHTHNEGPAQTCPTRA